MNSWLAILKRAPGKLRDFLDEKAVKTAHRAPLSRLHRFAHFWLMVWRSFSQNRCLMRASALAYISLLALIPVLFVVFSISSSILKGETESSQSISRFIYSMLVTLTPPTSTGTNAPSGAVTTNASAPLMPGAFMNTNDWLAAAAGNTTNAVGATITPETKSSEVSDGKLSLNSQQQMVQSISGFVQNIQGSKLGVLGVMMLVFVAISMLSSIEGTFNDIWSVSRGRAWMARIIQYWAVISLGPLVLAVVLGLTSGSHLAATEFLRARPLISWLLFQLLPLALLCLAFSLFYLLMPNTKVHWDAALVGGLMGGFLWYLNNHFSVLYVSRWVTNSKIYGNLAIIPVFMAGLYFSWLIVLFGAQVAHAFQNRSAYLQEKLAENINQRGREFVALRLMECIGQRFQFGRPAATVPEIADGLAAPTRLIHQIMQTLLAAQLVVEISGAEPAYAPARPLENITCHDILLAMRAGQGEELATRDEPARAEVFGEFERILDAEKRAAASVSVLGMVMRGGKLSSPPAEPIKAVTDGKS